LYPAFIDPPFSVVLSGVFLPLMQGKTSVMYRSMISAKAVRTTGPKLAKPPLSSSLSVCFVDLSLLVSVTTFA